MNKDRIEHREGTHFSQKRFQMGRRLRVGDGRQRPVVIDDQPVDGKPGEAVGCRLGNLLSDIVSHRHGPFALRRIAAPSGASFIGLDFAAELVGRLPGLSGRSMRGEVDIRSQAFFAQEVGPCDVLRHGLGVLDPYLGAGHC